MRTRGRTRLAGAAAAGVFVLAGCGGGEPETAPANPAEAEPAAPGATVDVEASEFALALSEDTVEAGPVTFVLRNSGEIDHALEVEGPEGETETGTVAPGETAELTVTLEDGASYELYCPIGDHREQGMALELRVGGGGGATTEEPATTGGGDSRY